MRWLATLLFIFPGAILAQVDFECQVLGAFTPGDCDGILSSSLAVGTGIYNSNPCGFPANGLQHAEIHAFGPIGALPVPGGPLARPPAGAYEEIRIPIPAGTTQISFCWDFYNGELFFGSPTPQFNDGVDISIVDAVTGVAVQNLAYADAFTATAPNNCSYTVGVPANPAFDSVADGPNSFGTTLVIPTTGNEVLSIVVWNGTDNLFSSAAAIDGILFNTATAICGSLPPQPPQNEDCDSAFTGGFLLNPGVNTGFSNAQATASGIVSPCGGSDAHDVWFFFSATSSCSMTFDTVGSGFDTVLTLWDGNTYTPGLGMCGTLPLLACNDDIEFPGNVQSSVTIPLATGDVVFVQVASAAAGFTGPLTININPALSLSIGQPSGPGAPLHINNACGSPGSIYITAISLAPGNFPNGWFHGVDVPFASLLLEIGAGPPFIGNLTPSGESAWSSGVPLSAGLDLYAVSLSLAPVTGSLLQVSAPINYLTQ